jgi:hypothetical protein
VNKLAKPSTLKVRSLIVAISPKAKCKRVFREVVLFNILKKINVTNFTLSYCALTVRLFNDAFLAQAI